MVGTGFFALHRRTLWLFCLFKYFSSKCLSQINNMMNLGSHFFY